MNETIGIPLITFVIGTSVTVITIISVAIGVGVAWGGVKAQLVTHGIRIEAIAATMEKGFDSIKQLDNLNRGEIRSILERIARSEGREFARFRVSKDDRGGEQN